MSLYTSPDARKERILESWDFSVHQGARRRQLARHWDGRSVPETEVSWCIQQMR